MSGNQDGRQYPPVSQNEAFQQAEWPMDLPHPSGISDIGGLFPIVEHQAWPEPFSMPPNSTGLSSSPPSVMLPPPPRPVEPMAYDSFAYQSTAGAAGFRSLEPQRNRSGQTLNVVGHAHPTHSTSASLPAGGNTQAVDGARKKHAGHQGAADTPTQRKRRTRPPSESEWERHKRAIYTMYLQENLSLADTMEYMEKLNFKASEKMYKQMFKKWRWSKNLPKDKATWMINRANQRRPKDTEFRWGNQVWSVDRVMKTQGRVPEEPGTLMNDHPTPSDISYSTPHALASNSEHVERFDEQGDDGGLGAKSARTAIFRALDDGPVHLNLTAVTLEDLRSLAQAAWDGNRRGNTEDAESQLQDVLCGFSRLLSPTHDEALKAGYHLACFYADHKRMDEADETINWMTKQHRDRYGTDDEKTLRHLTRVVDLLQGWGRQEHASLLAFRILDSVDNMERLDVDVIPHSGRGGRVPSEVQGGKIASRIASLEDDADGIEAYLRFLRNLTGSKDNFPLLQEILPILIRHCDSFLEILSRQGVESSCLLAETEMECGDDEAARIALAGSEAAFMDLLSKEGTGDVPESLRTLGRRLAFCHLDAQDGATCDRLLETMTTSIESRVGLLDDEDADALAVSFLVSIGGEYDRRKSWEQCRPWIERSLAMSILAFGPRNRESKRLMRMLDNEKFGSTEFGKVEDFMKFSGRLFKIKIV